MQEAKILYEIMLSESQERMLIANFENEKRKKYQINGLRFVVIEKTIPSKLNFISIVKLRIFQLIFQLKMQFQSMTVNGKTKLPQK